MFAKWNLNNRCNLHCSFCCVEDDKNKEITLEEKYKILDILYNGGVRDIDFFGKEPLVDDTIFKIMRYGEEHDYDINYSFITNGLNLMKYREDIINSPCRSFTVSYDFGYARQFNIPLEDLVDFPRDFYIELSIDVHKGNTKSILDSLPLLCTLGINSIYLKPILPEGSLAVNVMDYISEEEYFDFTNRVICTTRRPYCIVSVPYVFNKRGWITEEGVSYEIHTDPKCSYGKTLFIDSDSTLYGCGCACYALNKELSARLLDTPFDEALKIIRSYKGGKRMCIDLHTNKAGNKNEVKKDQ